MRFGTNGMRLNTLSAGIKFFRPRTGVTGNFTGTSKVVTHGIGVTPVDGEIQVTPVALGGCTEWYVDTVGASTFTINVNPSATNANFAWKINLRQGDI